MQKLYRGTRVSMAVIMPVLALIALLVLSQRAAAPLAEPLTALHIQTLRTLTQEPVELPVTMESVTVTKRSDVEAVRVGNTVRYDVVIENGSGTTVTVDIEDQLPDELQLRGVYTGTAVLPPTDAALYTATVSVAPMEVVTLTYETLVLFTEEPGSDVVNTVRADVSAPDVSFTLLHSDTISVELSAILLPIIYAAE